MKKINYLILLAAIILASCQPKPAPVDLKAEADSIRILEDQWSAANQAKDVDKVVGLLSAEFVGLPPNAPRMIGIDSLRKSMEKFFADTMFVWDSYKFAYDKIEVAASGDLAYVFGTQTLTIKTPGGPVVDVGKGVDIWKKENGKWKAVVSIWNSDPPQGGE